jgi:hypothetical protein
MQNNIFIGEINRHVFALWLQSMIGLFSIAGTCECQEIRSWYKRDFAILDSDGSNIPAELNTVYAIFVNELIDKIYNEEVKYC